MMRYHVNSVIVKGGTILARRDGFAPYFSFIFVVRDFITDFIYDFINGQSGLRLWGWFIFVIYAGVGVSLFIFCHSFLSFVKKIYDDRNVKVDWGCGELVWSKCAGGKVSLEF